MANAINEGGKSAGMNIFQPGKARDLAMVFIIVLAVLLFRRHDAFTYPQLWDEDGAFYLSNRELFGWRSLFIHTEYLTVIPILIANLFGALHVNLVYIPLCYNMSAFVITLLVAVRLYFSADFLNLKHKILYAVSFLILPIGADMFMNITNIMWVTSLFLVDYIFVGYKHGNKYVNLVVLTLVCFTSPTSLILSPIVALIILIERKKIKRAELMNLCLIMLAGAAQFLKIVTYGINLRYRSKIAIFPGMALPPEHYHFIRLVSNNLRELLFFNGKLGLYTPLAVQYVLCVIGFILFVYLVYRSYVNVGQVRKYAVALSGLFFMVSFVLSFWPQESKITAFTISRYYFLPYTCLSWILIIGYDKAIKMWHLLVYAAFFGKHYSNVHLTLYDKQWNSQVQEYYQGKRDTININEGGPNWGWQVILPHKAK